MKSIFILIAFALINSPALALKKSGASRALKGGTFSLGAGLGMGSVSQDGLNELIRTAKTSSLATTDELNSATEYLGFANYRFANNIVALQLRASYFTQTSKGSGTGGGYDYSLSGYTVFPMLRYIPLSNDFIDFFIQGGLGYGKLDGTITNDSRQASFTGGSFGTQVGLGADFCFLPEHCLGVEGNYRYLPIERNKVTSASGALPDGVGQAANGRELENSAGDDIPTKLSGVFGVITYIYNF